MHGGQLESLWQVWSAGCSQSCSLEHGREHGGGLVPQGTGGYKTSVPHSQYNSSKLVLQQGWQCPRWHNCSQRCSPQLRLWLHGSGQGWSISIQQSWLHLCLAQLRFFVHFFSHLASSALEVSWSHGNSRSICPHRHLTNVVSWQGGQAPEWHFVLHWCGLLGCPQESFRLHIFMQVGIGSKQLFLFSSGSWLSSVCPHGQWVIRLGASWQGLHSPSWQMSSHLWLPQVKSWPHGSLQLNSKMPWFSGIQSTSLVCFLQKHTVHT